MNDNVAKLLRKLDRPPSGPNFVRLLDEDPSSVARNILKFVLGRIRFHYQPGIRCIADYVRTGANIETLRKAILRSGAPSGRMHNLSLLDSFVEYEQIREFRSLSYLDFDNFIFQVAPGIRVPVSPTLLGIRNKNFELISVCGWNNFPFSELQCRYLWSMLEDAVFSLSDLRTASADFLHFPKQTLRLPDGSVVVKRQPLVKSRGDYELLSKAEMDELSETYLAGRELARLSILASAEKSGDAEGELPGPEEDQELDD